MAKIFLILIVLWHSVMNVCASEIIVALAANVQGVFSELKKVFEKDTGIDVKGIVGSSGKLFAQVKQGAPFDIFLSADTKYPEMLQDEGLTHNAPQIYAYGTLILWTCSDVKISAGIDILDTLSVRRVAIANPETSPYGRQAVNVMKHYGLYETFSQKRVYGESIASVNQFIASGAVDVGFTSKSIVFDAHMKNKGQWVEILKDAYEPIAQAVVILKFAEKEHLSDSLKFYYFIFSEQAQGIFRQYGYQVVKKDF